MYRFVALISLIGLTILSIAAQADPTAPTQTQSTHTDAPAISAKSKAEPHVVPQTPKSGSNSEHGPVRLGPLPIEADWSARAQKWFSSTDLTGRRKEMRTMTRALKQPCRYCHTPDFKGYTDKRLISQQMMAISAEYQVACSDCHSGKVDMTPMGQIAQKMWALAHKKKVECRHCHEAGAGFLNLTDAGKAFLEGGP